jgi:hypothetical protein
MDKATSALQAIPFEQLIGGPLNAAVKAQALAATTSVDFIRSVGFNQNGEIINIKFVYQREGRQVTLEVPLITIVPIPYLRIDNMTINFKAQLSASGESNDTTTSSQNANVSASAGGGFFGQKYNFNASVSSKKDSSSSSSSKYSIEYTMDITVHAVQDDIPKGLSTVLGLLSEQMKPIPQAVSQQSITQSWESLSKTQPNAGVLTISSTSVALKDGTSPEPRAVPGVPVTFELLVDGQRVAFAQGKTNTSGNLDSDLTLKLPGDMSKSPQLRMNVEGTQKEAVLGA